MALVHADNFSIYGTNTALMLNGVYASVNQVSLATDPDGLSPGNVVHINSNNPGGVRFIMPSAQTTVGVAARIWAPNLNFGFNVRPAIAYRDSGGSTTTVLDFDTTGRIRLRSNAGTIATSTNPVITANGWYHIEAKIVCGAGATDSYEVRVEGITVMSVSAVNLQIDSVYQVEVGNPNFSGNDGSATDVYWKDLVIWDGTGTYNNDFLGSVLVTNLMPTSDISLNWTPSTGTVGWSILDNIPPVDTTYLSAPYNAGGPPFFPNPYVATLSDLPITATSVKGVITFVRAAKSDGGDGNLQVGIISDPTGTPTTALGADRPITVAQTYWRDVFEVDPDTAAPWLPAAVNAAQIQLNRTV